MSMMVAPWASAVAAQVLVAEVDAEGPLFQAGSIQVSFATVANLRPDPSTPLFDAPRVTVTESVIWPGAPYLGARASGRVRLGDATVEGGWGTFLGQSMLPEGSSSTTFRVTSEAPTFTADGTYRLAARSVGTDVVPARRATDADGSAADLGAYGGGGRRRLALELTLAYQTAVSGNADVIYLYDPPADRGDGISLELRQELPSNLAARVRGSVYRADRPNRALSSTIGPDEVRMVTAGLGLLYEVRFTPRLGVAIGPQVSLARWRYTLDEAAEANFESLGHDLLRNSGTFTQVDLAAEDGVGGAAGGAPEA